MNDLNQSFDIPLHDIKDIVEVDDYSFYYFLGGVFLLLIFVVALVYMVYKWYVKKNLYNIKKEHYKILKKLDLTNTKKAAYTLTLLGATFKDDTPRHTQMYENLTKRLQKYKYKKEVEGFDDETLGYIKLYQEMIDV